MVSTHLYEKCTRCGENLTILTFYFFSPILAIDANGGEVLEGLMELALCLFLWLWCLVLYIVETPPPVMVGNICNEFMFIHTCIDYGGVCSIYVVGPTSHTFVVFDVSATGSCSLISIL